MKLFSNDVEGYFISRPNRFIVTAETSTGIIRAHCPNPGRLQEILIPGRKLFFERNRNPARKTEYSLAAAHYKGKVIPLHSVKANRITEKLVLPLLYPGADKILPEQQFGNSRFDFLIIEKNLKTFLEVKACSLVEESRGMFPDAPTIRSRRHIKELSALAEENSDYSGRVLFVIFHPDVRVFTPNIHTDPEFSKMLLEVSSNIKIDAVSIECSAEGEVRIKNPHVAIDLNPVKYVLKDSGVYMLLITLKHTRTIVVGKLRNLSFKQGYYIYAGSAKRHLSKRIKRHLSRIKKNLHWHIDYLTEKADMITAFPIYTGKNIECTMAGNLEKIGGIPVADFGSGDCRCSSHLFYFKDNPIINENFLEILYHHRHNP